MLSAWGIQTIVIVNVLLFFFSFSNQSYMYWRISGTYAVISLLSRYVYLQPELYLVPCKFVKILCYLDKEKQKTFVLKRNLILLSYISFWVISCRYFHKNENLSNIVVKSISILSWHFIRKKEKKIDGVWIIPKTAIATAATAAKLNSLFSHIFDTKKKHWMFCSFTKEPYVHFFCYISIITTYFLLDDAFFSAIEIVVM